jgi:flagellar basal body-associated protein FliL
MDGGNGGLRKVWVAIILLGALFAGGAAALLFWVVGHGSQVEGRAKGAIAAGGATFLGVATLGLTVGIFLGE